MQENTPTPTVKPTSTLGFLLSQDNNATRERRVRSLLKNIATEQSTLIINLEREENALQAKLESLSDQLAPDDTTSLKFGKDADGKDLDCSKWVADVQATKEAIEEVKFRLEIARGTLQEFTQQQA